MVLYGIGWSIGIINLVVTLYLYKKTKYSQIAQLAELRTVNPLVVGSNPALGAMTNENNYYKKYIENNKHEIGLNKDQLKRDSEKFRKDLELSFYKGITEDMLWLFEVLAENPNDIQTWFKVKDLMEKYKKVTQNGQNYG